MEPFYFQTREATLFGVYHPPAVLDARQGGVVLCHPIGHEYLVAHRAFALVARRLSDAGVHVLRFDYQGTGDSSGTCEEGGPSRWLDDISSAVGALRLRMGSPRVSLIGCRLGATLSVLAGSDRGDIERLALWDPVVSGKAYLAELALRQKEMLAKAHVTPPDSRSAGAQPQECLGFAMPDDMRREIEGLDLSTLQSQPARDLLVIDTSANGDAASFTRHLQSLRATVDHRRIPVASAWTWIEDVNAVLVPTEVVNQLVSWMSAVR